MVLSQHYIKSCAYFFQLRSDYMLFSILDKGLLKIFGKGLLKIKG
jgi:hypothetical protein